MKAETAMHEDDDRGRAGGRTAWRQRFGSALDRLLAQRAADVDATYAQLDDRHPAGPDERAVRGASEPAGRGRAPSRSRPRRRPHRVARWFRLRFVTAALGVLLAVR